MKKKPIALQKKLYLNKDTVSRLDTKERRLIKGGDLVGPPPGSFNQPRCTSIEPFRFSYEIACPETQTGPCTGLYCITTGPTC